MPDRPKRVAAIHDLSGFGRCSLSVILPTLSVMGVQVCPIPTAVFSTHTGGLGEVQRRDLSDFTLPCLEHYQRLGLEFECVYSGFLSSEEQIDHCLKFFSTYKDAFAVVDPVMGDHGRPYRTITPGMRARLGELVQVADVITPNLTEALLLLGEDASRAKQPFGQEEIRQFARRLSALGPKTVIVTGIEEEEKIWNIGFDAGTQQFFAVSTQRRGAGYSGTGDILSSVICGCMVRGEGAQAALERAAKLLEISIAEAVADGTDPNEGIAFEHHLRLLMD